MDDISNRTLAILLIAAMVVSLGGTILSLNRLSVFRTPAQQIAGLATGTGTAEINISQETTISMVINEVDFGTGIINVSQGCTNATLASSHNDTNWTAEHDVCWQNTSGEIVISDNDLIVRNDGNINLTITMASEDNDAATFIGGTAVTPLYQYISFDNETGSCDNPQLPVNISNVMTWHNINSSGSMAVCDKLKAENSEDEVRIAIKVRVPKDASGEKSDTLTFTSTA